MCHQETDGQDTGKVSVYGGVAIEAKTFGRFIERGFLARGDKLETSYRPHSGHARLFGIVVFGRLLDRGFL